jgi:hypothetical protein
LTSPKARGKHSALSQNRKMSQRAEIKQKVMNFGQVKKLIKRDNLPR